jgi:hypothetical protein
MLWPKAMAGVVRLARVPTTPRWLPPALPLLIEGGERSTYVALYRSWITLTHNVARQSPCLIFLDCWPTDDSFRC